MPHAIWSGTVAFGLVTIPVKIYSALRSQEIRFHFLHKVDEGRIRNVRCCSLDGKEVAYEEIVRGYEYEKGRHVIVTDEDFARVNPEATQSIDIIEFVQVSEIDPIYFDTPYYLEPEKRGAHAYALLRETLRDAGKVGIARVVLRSREHLAALKPEGDALMLEVMRFDDEIVRQTDFKFPKREKPVVNEMKVAKMLIETMSAHFAPERFQDTYREQLLAMIQARAEGKEMPKHRARAAHREKGDLMEVLRRSLNRSKPVRGARVSGSHRLR